MKICVGSAGRFHTFDLARQLERNGLLERLYTAYPSWKVDGLARDKVSTFPWLMTPAMLAGRFGFSRLRDRLNFPVVETFNRWMADRLAPCDAFHCLSSFGLRSHRAARAKFGALTICDRGSAHIVFQDRILREEYARFGLQFPGIDPRIIERELEEYDFCDLIFVPSTFALRSFVEQGVPPAKLRLNPYGVDLAMFHPAPKLDSTFRVLFVGTLSIRKGIGYLLEAIASLAMPGLELCLIGAIDPDIHSLLAKYQGIFRYLRIVSRSDLQKHYSQASVLVLPSVEDGFGLVMAQAMACGVPVIATENTGAADLFTDGVEGFIVPIRNHAALREKLLAMIDSPAMRDQMAQAALSRVRSIAGWDDYGRRAADYYRAALAARSAVTDANSLR